MVHQFRSPSQLCSPWPCAWLDLLKFYKLCENAIESTLRWPRLIQMHHLEYHTLTNLSNGLSKTVHWQQVSDTQRHITTIDGHSHEKAFWGKPGLFEQTWLYWIKFCQVSTFCHLSNQNKQKGHSNYLNFPKTLQSMSDWKWPFRIFKCFTSSYYHIAHSTLQSWKVGGMRLRLG